MSSALAERSKGSLLIVSRTRGGLRSNDVSRGSDGTTEKHTPGQGHFVSEAEAERFGEVVRRAVTAANRALETQRLLMVMGANLRRRG